VLTRRGAGDPAYQGVRKGTVIVLIPPDTRGAGDPADHGVRKGPVIVLIPPDTQGDGDPADHGVRNGTVIVLIPQGDGDCADYARYAKGRRSAVPGQPAHLAGGGTTHRGGQSCGRRPGAVRAAFTLSCGPCPKSRAVRVRSRPRCLPGWLADGAGRRGTPRAGRPGAGRGTDPGVRVNAARTRWTAHLTETSHHRVWRCRAYPAD
jgi:hypothetical protein